MRDRFTYGLIALLFCLVVMQAFYIGRIELGKPTTGSRVNDSNAPEEKGNDLVNLKRVSAYQRFKHTPELISNHLVSFYQAKQFPAGTAHLFEYLASEKYKKKLLSADLKFQKSGSIYFDAWKLDLQTMVVTGFFERDSLSAQFIGRFEPGEPMQFHFFPPVIRNSDPAPLD